MKKVQVKKIIFLMLSALLLMGCKKNDGPVIDPNMEQPVLGEDAEGYGGFTYLQAYSFGEEGGNSVLYLPKDENAYVGQTTMICKTEGVEVTVNYNPTVSDEVADKTVRDKLEYILDSEYSDIYIEKFEDFKRNDAEKKGENIAFSSLTYLIYDEEQKGYVANWMEQCYVALDDGREFRISIKTDSVNATDNATLVFEELEKYIGVDFQFEKQLLEKLVSNHDLDSTDQAKIDGVKHYFGKYSIYLPVEYKENLFSYLMWDKSDLKEYDDLDNIFKVYSLDEYDTDPAFAIAMINMKMKEFSEDGTDMNSGQFGTLTEGEMQVFTQQLVGSDLYMDGTATDVDSLSYTDLGFVFRVIVDNYKGYDACMYLLYHGEDATAIYALAKDGAASESELTTLADQIYKTIEIK